MEKVTLNVDDLKNVSLKKTIIHKKTEPKDQLLEELKKKLSQKKI